MDYGLGIEQKLLKDGAREFFAKESVKIPVRETINDYKGYDANIWKKMAELGWMGILVPDQYGGSGMAFIDMVVLLYEMGYAFIPGPFFPSSVVGVIALLEAGHDTQKLQLLPEVIAGSRILTLAWCEKRGTYSSDEISVRAELQSDHYILSGTNRFVPYAHIADTILCAAKIDESAEGNKERVSLFIVDKASPGLSVQVLSTIANDKQCEVTFDRVIVPRQNIMGEGNNGWPILKKVLQMAAVAKCAEMCGGAQKVLEMVVDHAKKRVQFGSPIGSFQAIQHHCANILTYVDTSALMTYQASWLISKGLPFEKEGSMCKVWVSDSYRKLVALGHQVMGGTGYMEEVDLQLYFKHAKAAELAYGDSDLHRELVAEHIGL